VQLGLWHGLRHGLSVACKRHHERHGERGAWCVSTRGLVGRRVLAHT
jgi:hypothetical protein